MRRSLALLALPLLAACAHTREGGHRDAAPVDRAAITADVVAQLEPRLAALVADALADAVAKPSPPTESLPQAIARPDAAYARVDRWGQMPEASGAMVAIPAKESGYSMIELFEMVSRETNTTIRYEESNAVVRSKRLTFVGDEAVPKSRLFAWLQAVVAPHGLVLIPSGEQGAWFVLDQANANLTSTPMVVDEDALPAYVGRSGLYVSCVLTLPHDADAARIRQTLSQLSTKTAGLGRINDIPGDGGHVIVGDFAPIVATMRRLLDNIVIHQYEAQLR